MNWPKFFIPLNFSGLSMGYLSGFKVFQGSTTKISSRFNRITTNLTNYTKEDVFWKTKSLSATTVITPPPPPSTLSSFWELQKRKKKTIILLSYCITLSKETLIRFPMILERGASFLWSYLIFIPDYVLLFSFPFLSERQQKKACHNQVG